MNSLALNVYAAAVALVGWGAITLQICVLLLAAAANGGGVGWGIVVSLGYFTILTNILVALALTTFVVAPDSGLGRFLSHPGVSTALAASITFVGLAYSGFLRHLWEPRGLQLIADVALHDVMPVLFLVFWWVAVPKSKFHWTNVLRWLAYPAGYLLCILVLAIFTGFYPYPYIDVGTLGYGRVLVNVACILLGFSLIALLLGSMSKLKADHRS